MITGRKIKALSKKGWKFRIRWMSAQGLCHYQKEELSLNPMKSLASILIHEAFHALHPKMSHPRVYMMEDLERFTITKKRAEGIVKAFSPKLYKAIKALEER